MTNDNGHIALYYFYFILILIKRTLSLKNRFLGQSKPNISKYLLNKEAKNAKFVIQIGICMPTQIWIKSN